MPESDPSTLTAFLADRDVPCPGCGYNLRGLVGARCTECGIPLDSTALIRSLADDPRRAKATLWFRNSGARFALVAGPVWINTLLIGIQDGWWPVLALAAVVLSAAALWSMNRYWALASPSERSLPITNRLYTASLWARFVSMGLLPVGIVMILVPLLLLVVALGVH